MTVKPYTLQRAIRELEIFKRLVAVQQKTIEACEELHQLTDEPMKPSLESIIASNRAWQKECIRFQVECEKMIAALSHHLGDLRQQR